MCWRVSVGFLGSIFRGGSGIYGRKDSRQTSVPFSDTNRYPGPKCAFGPTRPDPAEARRMGPQGTVIALAVVGTDGKPGHFGALENAPGNLAEAVLQELKHWLLTPPTRSNRSPAGV